MNTLKQQFLCIPLLKKNTDKQLDQIKETLNQVAVCFGCSIEYTVDRENGWFKADVQGDSINTLKFLMHYAGAMG